MTEFEIKLEVPAARLAAVAKAMRAHPCTRQRLRARYFDTVDDALARQGIVVRVRQEGRHWVQTAKAPSANPLQRLEHNVDLPRPAAGTAPALDLARHAGTPVGERIAQALGLKGGEPMPALVLLFEIDVQRLACVVEYQGTAIELALDQGRVTSGGPVSGGPAADRAWPLCELELELKHGRPAHAVQLARQWCDAHGLWLSLSSKSGKGQRLRRGETTGPVVVAEAPAPGRHAGGQALAMAVLGSCLAQVLGNAGELADGTGGPQHLHQLRIGIRRLRLALAEFGALVPGVDAGWEAPLADVFRRLGRWRDQDNLVRGLWPQWAQAGGPAFDTPPANLAHEDPVAIVRTPAFQAALLGLTGLVHGGGQGADEGAGGASAAAVRRHLRERLHKLHREAVRQGRKFLALDEAGRHRVRKRLKRLRYLAEFAAPLFSRRKAAAFVAGLKPAQDALGASQDEWVALQACAQLAASDPRAWFGLGWLHARRAGHATACAASLEGLARLRPFWDQVRD